MGAAKLQKDNLRRVLSCKSTVFNGSGTSRVNAPELWTDLAIGAPEPPVDSDHDGISDISKKAHDLDPHDATDGAAIASNGYSIVDYLNEVAGDSIPGPDR